MAWKLRNTARHGTWTKSFLTCIGDISGYALTLGELAAVAVYALIWEVTMFLIIGGAYQGRLDFVKENFAVTEGDVHFCDCDSIDFSRRCICNLEEFADVRDDTCIITHGGVIAAIMEHLFPDEGKNRYQWQPKPGCGYTITDGRQYRKL